MHKPPKIDHSKAVESAARFKDIVDRASVARPVDTGRDILKTASVGKTELF